MGWKIPEIKIRVPEVRVPKARAGRVMPKPRAVGPASGKIEGFSLTIFSSNKVPIETKHMDVIKALIASGGNRKVASEKSGINKSLVSYHAKKIRNLPDARLREYAGKLKITVAEIMKVCADLNPTKGIADIDIIKALLASDGNRRAAAKGAGVNHGNVSQRAKKIRNLPVAKLQGYADELGVTVARIMKVCADLHITKGITRADVIKTLLETKGSRTGAAKKLGITPTGVSRHAENIRNLPDAQLAVYAKELGTSPAEIKKVCADSHTTKGITRIDLIKALLETEGSRTEASKKLGINLPAVSAHAKNVRNLPDIELAVYAKELGTSIAEIKRVCADLNSAKGITRAEIIKLLLETGGNRTEAAKKLRVHGAVVSNYAEDIRNLTDAQLRKYADQLKTTVAEIRRVCADLTAAKGITHLDVIKALIETDGSRIDASVKLGVHPSAVSKYVGDIRRLPDAQLQKYAYQLSEKTGKKITVSGVREAVSRKKKSKINFEQRLKIIRALIETGGNRTEASEKLGINTSNVSHHAKNIRYMSDAELAACAQKIGVSIAQIKNACADLNTVKGVVDIDVIKALLQTKGDRGTASKKLGISQGGVSHRAKKIRSISDIELQKYADQLKITVAEIRKACADLESRKGITHIDVIKALFGAGGNKASAAEKLGISAHAVINHAKNIRQLPEAGLAEYAAELGVSVEQIKNVCSSPLKRARGKLFGK